MKPPRDATKWRKEASPALSPDRALDDRRILCPWVVAIRGGFRLFYMGHGRASAPGTTGRILSARSGDGITWEKEEGVRIDNGEGADARALSPCVVRLTDGALRMYYEAYATPDGAGSVVLSARSDDDGETFTKEPGVRVAIDGARVGSPRALLLDGDRVRLYFHRYPEPYASGLGRGNHVESAVSHDGLGFVREPGVRIPQTLEPRERSATYCAQVVAEGDGRLRAFYGAWNDDDPHHAAIMTAVSDDGGLSFTKGDAPVIDPGGPFDAAFASEPCVFADGLGRLRMVYEGCDANGVTRILAATSVL
ncbi:MAG: hypothetical protein JST00_28125 [Deltaproteobacteria bacterium]|nr:hypothetical protein [Deltaproteobacteria bacterium]